MPKLGISSLRLPHDNFRPDLKLADFETLQAAIIEDATRARILTASGAGHSQLVDRLNTPPASRDGQLSLASSVDMRGFRTRFGGQLWRLVDRTAPLRPATFTLIPAGWEFTPAALARLDPKRLMASVRYDLRRCQDADADGYLVAFFHGEFDIERGTFQGHLHGCAAGGMREKLELLRAMEKYRPTETIRYPIRITSKPLTKLPGPLTYICKAYWPARWMEVGSVFDGRMRQSTTRRIPEPHHSAVLEWLHQWRPEDVSLMRHLSIKRGRFHIARHAHKRSA